MASPAEASPDYVSALGGLLFQPAGIALAVAIVVVAGISWKVANRSTSFGVLVFGVVIAALGVWAQHDHDQRKFDLLEKNQRETRDALVALEPLASAVIDALRSASTQAGNAASNSGGNQGPRCSAIAFRSRDISDNAVPSAQKVLETILNTADGIVLGKAN